MLTQKSAASAGQLLIRELCVNTKSKFQSGFAILELICVDSRNIVTYLSYFKHLCSLNNIFIRGGFYKKGGYYVPAFFHVILACFLTIKSTLNPKFMDIIRDAIVTGFRVYITEEIGLTASLELLIDDESLEFGGHNLFTSLPEDYSYVGHFFFNV